MEMTCSARPAVVRDRQRRESIEEETMTVPVLELKGSPREIGRRHGEQVRELVHDNVRFYMDLWQHMGGVGREKILSDVEAFVPFVERYDGDLVEEMRGIAEGAGLEFREIAALNARTELTFSCLPNTLKDSSGGGCTSFGLLPEVTENGHLILGQNWDWRAEALHTCVVLRIEQENKPSIVMHAEAGTVGHRGINSSGLGVCINYIRTENDGFRPGLPFLIKLRGILNSTRMSDALRMLMTYVGPNSMNMVIGQQGGEIVDVENLPNDLLFVYPQDGILTHANHFESPMLRVRDTGKSTLPDTILRSRRLRRLLSARSGRLNVETIREALTDHFSYPDSICRHPDERSPRVDQWQTLSSIILDLTDLTLRYTDGPPCSGPYHVARLP
jgi:isopenicillin-N N-acyltransferase-like protein